MLGSNFRHWFVTYFHSGTKTRDGFGRLSWAFLTSPPSSRAENAGIYPALIGSLYVIATTAMIAVPAIGNGL